LSERARVEVIKPDAPRALAILMIAARENPRRSGKELGPRLENVGVPRAIVIAGGSSSTLRLRGGGAGIFAIEIIADVDYQIRAGGRGRSGDILERPLRKIVAILQTRAFNTAAGVAEYGDPSTSCFG
jgi:hypothetical protein